MGYTVDAGELRHLVTLQTPTRTPSSQSGEIVLTWSDTRTTWASVKPASSADKFQYAQNQARITHEIIVRYATDITGDCRFTYGGRVFNIIGAPMDQDERHATLKIMVCEEA